MTELPIAAHEQGYYSRGITARVQRPRQFGCGIGNRIVTDMVKLIKLTKDLVANFPGHSADMSLQINELFEIKPVWRPFFRGKIVPNRDKFCHFLPKTWQDMAENRSFSRPILLKGVKSGELCRAVIGARRHFPSLLGRQSGGLLSQTGQAESVVGGGASQPAIPLAIPLVGKYASNLARGFDKPIRRSPCADETWRCQHVDHTMVTREVGQMRKCGLIESKGLNSHVARGRRKDNFGVCRATETGRRRSADSTRVDSQVRSRRS